MYITVKANTPKQRQPWHRSNLILFFLHAVITLNNLLSPWYMKPYQANHTCAKTWINNFFFYRIVLF